MDSVEVVPLSLIHTVWPDVEKFLKDGLSFCEGDYTVEQAKVYITKGEWMLVVAVSENKLIKLIVQNMAFLKIARGFFLLPYLKVNLILVFLI